MIKTTLSKKGRELVGEELPGERIYTIRFWKNSWLPNGNEWIDLFEVKKSQLPNAGNGLFASKAFTKEDVMGVFFGTIIDPNTTTPTEYAMKSDTLGVTVDSKEGIESNHPKYFGLHFANDPSLFDVGTTMRHASKNIILI